MSPRQGVTLVLLYGVMGGTLGRNEAAMLSEDYFGMVRRPGASWMEVEAVRPFNRLKSGFWEACPQGRRETPLLDLGSGPKIAVPALHVRPLRGLHSPDGRVRHSGGSSVAKVESVVRAGEWKICEGSKVAWPGGRTLPHAGAGTRTEEGSAMPQPCREKSPSWGRDVSRTRSRPL
jgi:hypothetical protein